MYSAGKTLAAGIGLLFAASMSGCNGAGGSSGSGGYDGTYDCTGTTTTPAGTTSGTGTFSCSRGSCSDSMGAFTGALDANGHFSGSDVLCQTCVPLPMGGQFSTTQSFTISGSSGSVNAIFHCQCSGACGGGGGDGGGGDGGSGMTITGFTPTSGVSGSTVTIIGTDFPDGSSDGGPLPTPIQVTATICGLPATVQSVTSTEIVLVVPSIGAASTCAIAITTASGTVTSSITFTVHASTTLAPGTWPTRLALDSTYVYFTSSGSGTVSKAAKSGGPVTVLASGLDGPWGIAVDSDAVYWVAIGSGVQKVGLNGGSVTTLWSGYAGPYIAIDAGNVYWVSNNNSLMKTPKSGGATTLQTDSWMAGIGVDSTSVYWVGGNPGTVKKASSSVPGGAVSTLGQSLSLFNPTDLVVDSSNVYWGGGNTACTAGGGGVAKVGINGGAVTLLAAANCPLALAVDSANVYWTDSGGTTMTTTSPWGTLAKVGINGGTATVLAPGLTNPGGVAVESTNVFWTDTAVRAVAK